MDEAIPAAGANQMVIMADSDALILVDESDRRLGHLSKDLCHEGRGVLHRAFSLRAAHPATRTHQAAMAAILVE
jgi:hypothetical protein